LPTLGCSESPAPATGSHAKNPHAVRLLPLGDSITQANKDHQSYRVWLWQMLESQSIAVDFVGSMDANYQGDPSFPEGFDRNHEGHWGWRSDEILEKLPEWLQLYDADIALIHLGTNDCLQNQAASETLDELKRIAILLRQDKPEIKIAFSTLGPNTWRNAECLEQINQGLHQLSAELSTEQSEISVVEIHAQLQPSEHLYDGLHPHQSGEKVIAESWFEQLEPWLQDP